MPCRFNTFARAREAVSVMHHAPSKRLRCGLLAAAALAATISAGGPAQADTGYSVLIELDEAVIRVASDGERYTTVSPSSPAINGMMHVEFNAHRDGWIRSWAAWLSIETEVMGKKQFPELGYSENYAIGNRHKVVKRALPVSIPRQAYKTYAEEACNELAKDLQLLQGKTNTEIFSEDRSIAVQVNTERTWDMSGIVEANPPRVEMQDTSDVKPVTIVCLKAPSAPPGVTSAAIVVRGIDPANSQGQCQMRLNGNLRSNVPNLDVSFRYVDDKGNQSDLKTVTTGSDRWASFEHSYPLSPGQKSTKIKIVGESPFFISNSKDFDYECEEGSVSEFVPLLPPQATTLTYVVDKQAVHQGKVCPTAITVIGRIDGRGKSSGTITLGAGGNQIAEKPFSVIGDENKSFTGKHQISWQGKPATQQDIPLTLRVYGLKPTDNENSGNNGIGNEAAAEAHTTAPLQDALQRMVSLSCVDAEQPDQFVSDDAAPPMLTLSARGGEERLHQGYICPERISLKGRLRGQDDFNGQAVFVVKQEQSLAVPQSQEKEFNFAVTEGENLTFDFEPEVWWSNVPQNGEAPPKQTMDLSFRVVKTGGVVASVERSLEVSCKGVSLLPVGVDDKPKSYNGLSDGTSQQAQVQQGRKPAATGQFALQTGPAFAIQAPKGRVRAGRIELSGGPANAKYDLRFYRGTEGGYRSVRSAQLPRQMTGRTATFNLRALSGSRNWRIEVCPAGSKDKNACRSSDFQLPRLKGAGGVKAPADPAATKVFIMPGSGS